MEGTKTINLTLDRSCSQKNQRILTTFSNNATIVNDLLYVTTCYEYSLLKAPTTPGSGINQTIASFMFDVNTDKLKAEQYYAIGMLSDGRWVTPPEAHNLPAKLFRVKTLVGTLSFDLTWTSYSYKILACFGIIFGNAKNPASPTF